MKQTMSTDGRTTAKERMTSLEMSGLRRQLEAERREIENEKYRLEMEKKDFERRQELEEQRREQEKKLFDMKWKILEAELRKVAEEKEQIKEHRESYEQERQEQYRRQSQSNRTIHYDNILFFKGVNNELALKKRYRDLIKIFHPDNLAGDTNTIQIINEEYNEMKRSLCI